MVVVILGILATIAGYGYGRYIGHARRTEAGAILAEMAAKQQLYVMEFGSYLPLRNDGVVSVNPPPANEAANAFYPLPADSPNLESRRRATAIPPQTWPPSWRNVGMRPKRTETYCTYLLNAGAPGLAVPGGAPIGEGLLPTPGDTATNWFYALAACNLNGDAVWPGGVTVLALTHNSLALRTLNDGQ